MNDGLTVYGAPYSVYVRIVRLLLLEKGLKYTLEPVDVFADDADAEQRMVSPFGKIPVLIHDGFELYETSAITRYLDETFPSPRLMPDDPKERARANQIISIIDNYAYPVLVWGIYVPISEGKRFEETSEFEATKEKALQALSALETLASKESTFLLADDVFLPDLYAFSALYYFLKTDFGREMIEDFSSLSRFQENMSRRDGYASIMSE